MYVCVSVDIWEKCFVTLILILRQMYRQPLFTDVGICCCKSSLLMDRVNNLKFVSTFVCIMYTKKKK